MRILPLAFCIALLGACADIEPNLRERQAEPASALQQQTVIDRNAGFSIVFPGAPKNTSEYNPDIGAQVTIWKYNDYSAYSDDFTYYEFILVEFPAGWQAHNPSQHAAAYATSMVEGDQILASVDNTAGNRGGREITARILPDTTAKRYGVTPQLIHVKVVTVDNRVYLASSRYNEDGPATNARNFMSSLRVLR